MYRKQLISLHLLARLGLSLAEGLLFLASQRVQLRFYACVHVLS